MDFHKTTVSALFDKKDIQYTVPVYQRAYSWEENQLSTFFEDLAEQVDGNSQYFLGNILLETKEDEKKFDVIDGQQRLTTLVIFFRCMADELKTRQENGEDLSKIGFDHEECCDTYLMHKANKKFRPVSYDQAFFDNYIIEDKDDDPITQSQSRIRFAKDYFCRKLSGLSTDLLMNIYTKLSNTTVFKIAIDGKKEAALMFELQNNRGQDLTNMEKLKSYFMYQMYAYSNPNEADSNIEYITNLYNKIYTTFTQFKKFSMTEDTVLIFHCQAWYKNFAYRNIDEIKALLRNEKVQDKINWIKDFVYTLSRSFDSIRDFFNCNDINAVKLKAMNPGNYIYPFIVKGYHYLANNNIELSRLFRILTVIDYRDKLVNTRANLESRLNSVLSNFNGNIDDLKKNIKDKFSSEYYWSEEHVKSVLHGGYMYPNRALVCILNEYENSLQNKGYRIIKIVETPSIEHISPQKPDDEKLEKGYEVDINGEYTEEFTVSFLNSVGNLLYISTSHNSAIKNTAFASKLDSYNKNPLFSQQAEIKNFVDPANPNVWDSKCIERRRNKIISFCLKNWDLDTI